MFRELFEAGTLAVVLVVVGHEALPADLVAVAGQRQVQGLTRQNAPMEPAWSPDGQQIAIALDNGMYVVRPETGEKRLVFGEGTVECPQGLFRHPTWSPDGKSIAFAWREGGETRYYPSNIWVVNVDGTEARRLTRSSVGKDMKEEADAAGSKVLVSRNVYCYDPSWSPDGKKIAYSVNEEERVESGSEVGTREVKEYICTMDLESGIETTLVDGKFPVWSPDGKHLAYSAGTNSGTLHVLDLETSTTTEIVRDNRAVGGGPKTWSPDSTMIAGCRGGGVFVTNVSREESCLVPVKDVVGMITSCSWSSNGTRLAVEVEDQETYTIVVLDIR